MPKLGRLLKGPKMGLVKNYLRFVHEETFGVVAASQIGASINFLEMRQTKDRYVAAPANEDVIFWDLKTKQIVNRLTYGDQNNAAEVTYMDCYHGGHPRSNLIAVGYGNGQIRVYEYETGELRTTFTGHRTAIAVLKFDRDGARLASGGKDCNIVVWDIVGERGLFSLKGHKNSISELAFLHNEEHQKDLLISGSVDAVSTIKFWDLQTQHCFYTLSGQSNGVWSFVLIKNGTRMITGSSSPELRVYSIEFVHETKQPPRAEIEEGSEELDNRPGIVVSSEEEYGLKVCHLGNILRNSSSVSNRVQRLVVDKSETLLLCHSSDKNVELYGIRTTEQSLSYAKKKAKKEAKKEAKRKRKSLEESDGAIELDEPDNQVKSLDDLYGQKLVECEINRKLGHYKLDDKIKAIGVHKYPSKEGLDQYKIAVMNATNGIDSYLLRPHADNNDDLIKRIESLDSLSHRSDVRAISISPDRSLIMTASSESVKIWRTESRNCIATIPAGYATCCTFADAQHLISGGSYKNRFVFIGSKDGTLQIIDLSENEIIEKYQVCAEGKALNSIHVLPDKTGVVTGGEDGIMRIYNYNWLTESEDDDGQTKTKLALIEDRILEFQEAISCVRASADNRLIAIALLDSSVRIHFLDTFKYFLTLYGHKFPVTSMDISDDSQLILTGSADKNLKIWGLDFGDCHKSIFAHEEAITCVRFVPKTHHAFSCGRDRQIKEWDCDNFTKIQTLRKHQGEVWALDVSSSGKFLVTGSHDKSIRVYRKTEEIIVPADEEETERELDDERNVYEKQENIIVGEVNQETGFAAKMTIETIRSTDRLIEAIEVFGNEQQKEADYKIECETADAKGQPRPPEPERDPLLMTANTTDYNRYMLEVLRRIKSSDLEEILLTLPFDHVRKLMIILVLLLEKRWDIELLSRCATFLLKVNLGQIAACSALVPVVTKMRSIISDRTNHLRHCAGFNLIALEHLTQNRKYMKTKTNIRGISTR